MDTPQISRSGRVLKKSAKVKEMEDFDINEFDVQGKARKKSKLSDEYDEFDDKRVAPIKIPKISLNIASKRKSDVSPMSKLQFSSPTKSQEAKRSVYQDSSPEASKSESSSVSSESSSSSPSSSEDSDSEASDTPQRYPNVEVKQSSMLQSMQRMSGQQEKLIVDQYQQYDSPVAFVDHNNEMPPDASEDETSDSALVIAEESNDSQSYMVRGQKGIASKKKPVKKDPTYAPRRGSVQKKKPPSRNLKNVKNKQTWRRKAKRLAMKNSSGLISTGPANGSSPKSANRGSSNASDDALKGFAESSRPLGTSAIDAAAYLKLLGDSLSVIGQRLTEHEVSIIQKM